MEQRSPEWYAARLGKVTASRVADLMAKTKSGYSTSRANYMAELICERLTGKPTEGYTNGAKWKRRSSRVGRAPTRNPVAAHPGECRDPDLIAQMLIGMAQSR